MVFKDKNRLANLALWVAAILVFGVESVVANPPLPNCPAALQQDAPGESADQSTRVGVALKVSLPIDSNTASKLRTAIKRIVESAPDVVRPEQRQVVVLEFDTSNGKTGRGSELEACLSLARFLGGPDLNRVETVAYIPADAKLAADGFPSQLTGHAVLVAIAANQLAMDRGTAIGNAGIDEKNLQPLVREVYRGVASQRLTIPVPVVLSMLEKDQPLYRVRTDEGIVYVNQEQLTELEAQGKAIETTTVTKAGEMALLTSQQLADFRLLRYQVASRDELAGKLRLAPHSLEQGSAIAGQWRAVQVKLPPVVDQRTALWVQRSLGYRFARQDGPNLIILEIDNNTGDLDACLGLARYLVDVSTEEVQTVAFVRGTARGPIGLVALSCDQLIMSKEARLGGYVDTLPENELDEQELEDLKPMVVALARDSQQDWSLMMAMIDSKLSVTRFRNTQTGQVRLLSEEELMAETNAADWAPLGPVDVEGGLTSSTAEQTLVARTIADDMEQVKSFYELDKTPELLQPSAADRWVERAAAFLASPLVAPWLLFGAMFFFSTEMSAPGLGVPGFLAALCFLLFFWSQSLGGNADVLEILLFLVGIVFIGMEIFVLPGFGIFGIGGLLMVVVSLVLASQNFIIPRTSEELARLPQSLMPVVGAGMGFFVAIICLRNVLPNSPYFRRMMLNPRQQPDETGLERERDPEMIVDYSYLEGETGETITRLFPAGKARIGGQVYDVIADGRMMDKGAKIRVVEAVGNRVVVKPIEES